MNCKQRCCFFNFNLWCRKYRKDHPYDVDICTRCLYVTRKKTNPRQPRNTWAQQLPIGDDSAGYSIQIIDNQIVKNGEPRDIIDKDDKGKLDYNKFLETANSYIDEARDGIEKLNDAVGKAQERFISVIGSYIDMLNQVGLFATLIIGFGMAPISAMVADPAAVRFEYYLFSPFVWTSFMTVFASGWCVLECVFLAIALNVVSSTLITGWGSAEQTNQRAVKLEQLSGINGTWTGIMVMFFLSIATFVAQAVYQFLMGLHFAKMHPTVMWNNNGTIKLWDEDTQAAAFQARVESGWARYRPTPINVTDLFLMTKTNVLALDMQDKMTDNTTLATKWASVNFADPFDIYNTYYSPDKNLTTQTLIPGGSLDLLEGMYGTDILCIIIASSIIGLLLFWRCATKYIQFTSSVTLKVFTSILCCIPRCCLCYWPRSNEMDDPLKRLNYEYEFALKNLQYLIDETHHDIQQLFKTITTFPEDSTNKFTMKITLSKIRNLELFLLQIQEGRNKMLIREGKYSDLRQADSELDNLIYRKMGFAKIKRDNLRFKKQRTEIDF